MIQGHDLWWYQHALRRRQPDHIMCTYLHWTQSWRSKSNLTLFPSGATSQETHLVLLLEAEGPGKEDGGADEAETERATARRGGFF